MSKSDGKANGDGGVSAKEATERLVCGVVMPISAIAGCGAEHWLDVRQILYDAITDAGFKPNLVSNADEAGIIQKRIVQNLYENPVVVCDVSGKNPNVMFELGMRLAFDKPTVVVKDDQTDYSFDTSPVEHVSYPRDLRFGRIVEFKKALTNKLRATHEQARKGGDAGSFLKSFGPIVTAKLDRKEVPEFEYVADQLKEIRAMLTAKSAANPGADARALAVQALRKRAESEPAMLARLVSHVAALKTHHKGEDAFTADEIIDWVSKHDPGFVLSFGARRDLEEYINANSSSVPCTVIPF